MSDSLEAPLPYLSCTLVGSCPDKPIILMQICHGNKYADSYISVCSA